MGRVDDETLAKMAKTFGRDAGRDAGTLGGALAEIVSSAMAELIDARALIAAHERRDQAWARMEAKGVRLGWHATPTTSTTAPTGPSPTTSTGPSSERDPIAWWAVESSIYRSRVHDHVNAEVVAVVRAADAWRQCDEDPGADCDGHMHALADALDALRAKLRREMP